MRGSWTTGTEGKEALEDSASGGWSVTQSGTNRFESLSKTALVPLCFEQSPCVLGHVEWGCGPESAPGQTRSRKKPKHNRKSQTLEVWLCLHWHKCISQALMSRSRAQDLRVSSSELVASIAEKCIRRRIQEVVCSRNWSMANRDSLSAGGEQKH